jgi:hypothetical protein
MRRPYSGEFLFASRARWKGRGAEGETLERPPSGGHFVVGFRR